MHSTWSAARRIFSTRSARQAQIEGQTKCTVLMPAARRSVSRPKLKSGASMPTKNGWRLLEQALAQLPADIQNLGQSAKHFPAVAMHGQPLAGPPCLKTALLHLGPADAKGRSLGPAGLPAHPGARTPAGRLRFPRRPWQSMDSGAPMAPRSLSCRPFARRISAQCPGSKRPENPASAIHRQRPRAARQPALQWRRARPQGSGPGDTADGASA